MDAFDIFLKKIICTLVEEISMKKIFGNSEKIKE